MELKLLQDKQGKFREIYIIPCSCPIESHKWIKISEDIDEIKKAIKQRELSNEELRHKLVIGIIQKKAKEDICEIKIWDSLEDRPGAERKHFLSIGTMLEIDKKFLKIQNRNKIETEMYLKVYEENLLCDDL